MLRNKVENAKCMALVNLDKLYVPEFAQQYIPYCTRLIRFTWRWQEF